MCHHSGCTSFAPAHKLILSIKIVQTQPQPVKLDVEVQEPFTKYMFRKLKAWEINDVVCAKLSSHAFTVNQA